MSAPKLRFKEFDGNWDSIAIGKFLKIKSGLGFKAEEYTIKEEIRLLQIENVGYGSVKWTHNVKYVPIDYLKTHEALVLQEGDLVLALNRPVTNDQLKIAKLTSLDNPSILYQRVGKLEFTKEGFETDFIFQIFQKDVKNYVLNSSIGSDQPFISTTDLYKHKLSLPNQEEQTKIASFLSAVDQKISQLTQKHELLSQYKQGMMQKLFSQQIRFKADDRSEFGEWRLISIKDAISFIKDGTHGTHQDDPSSDLFLLSAKNLQNGNITVDEKDRKINQKEFDSIYKNYTLEVGDILLSVVGTIGRVAIFRENYKAYAFQRSVAFMRFKDALPEFIYQLFLAKKFQNELLVRQVVSAQPGIYLGDLSKIVISLPCLEEQTKIANFLSAIDQKIEVVAQQIEQAKTWKKGLLQQMFV